MVSLLDDRRRILLNTPHIEEVSDGIASFKTDVPANLKKCVVDIDPIQDLHGYDYPWPPGGGKNLLDVSNWIISGQESGVVDSTYLNLKPNTTYVISSKIQYSDTIGDFARVYAVNSSTSLSYVNNGVYFNRPIIVTTNEDGIIRIAYNSYNTVTSWLDYDIQVEEGLTATSYASYSNICPISGRTGMKVEKCGKNLFDKTKITDNAWLSTTTGLVETGVSNYCVSDYILVKKNQPIKIYTTSSIRRWFYDISKQPHTFLDSNATQTFIPPEDGFIRVTIKTDTRPIDQYQITSSAEDSTYEPYIGETYDITFPTEAGTVYGGTLDMLSGVLTVDRAMVDMGTLAWVYVGSGDTRYTTSSLSSVIKDSGTRRTPLVCSAYRVLSNGEAYDPTADGVIYTSGTGNIYVQDSSVVASTTGFITKVTGQTLVYPLATPTTYQFDPHILKAIRGTNNIWSDAGDTTVRFWTH